MKKTKKIVLIVLLAVVAILNFLLFPRRYRVLDGGSVFYQSAGFGFIYSIEIRHELSRDYYEVGTVIQVFGKEIFNNTHLDYDHPIHRNDEELAEEIRNIMAYESTRESE